MVFSLFGHKYIDNQKSNVMEHKNRKNMPQQGERDLNERQSDNLNIEKTANQEQKKGPQRHGSGSAERLDSIISSPTQNVRARHTGNTWSNTGTNISYEDQTAPGAGGSVGTGQASGQNATDSRINTGSDYERGEATRKHDVEPNERGNELKKDDKGYSKKGDNDVDAQEKDII